MMIAWALAVCASLDAAGSCSSIVNTLVVSAVAIVSVSMMSALGGGVFLADQCRNGLMLDVLDLENGPQQKMHQAKLRCKFNEAVE